MPAKLINAVQSATQEQQPQMVSSELRCALTGKPLRPHEVFWAPPLITAQQLLSSFIRTLFTAPGALGQLLLGELPNVPYDPAARTQLSARRTVEQLKILGLLLLLAALLLLPIFLLVA